MLSSNRRQNKIATVTSDEPRLKFIPSKNFFREFNLRGVHGNFGDYRQSGQRDNHLLVVEVEQRFFVEAIKYHAFDGNIFRPQIFRGQDGGIYRAEPRIRDDNRRQVKSLDDIAQEKFFVVTTRTSKFFCAVMKSRSSTEISIGRFSIFAAKCGDTGSL